MSTYDKAAIRRDNLQTLLSLPTTPEALREAAKRELNTIRMGMRALAEGDWVFGAAVLRNVKIY